MNTNRKRQYRRRNKNGGQNVVIALFVFALAAVLSVVWLTYRGKYIGGGGGSEAEIISETETVSEPPEEPTYGTDKSGIADNVAEESEPDILENDSLAEEPPESPYLESLSGLTAGTILREEQINFEYLDSYFMSWEIERGDNLFERINGKSYKANDYVPLHTLCYLKMPHYNFEGRIQVGELIVNEDIVEDVFSIFQELFRQKYQIESMYLVDNYWTGDPDTTDSASIDENNTSAFCYREITGGGKLSNHAYGRAIDLNPQQNPYVSYSTGAPRWSHSNANDYIARDTGLPHVITHEDLAYKLFKEHGFNWGGDWTNPKDYQHFDKNN